MAAAVRPQSVATTVHGDVPVCAVFAPRLIVGFRNEWAGRSAGSGAAYRSDPDGAYGDGGTGAPQHMATLCHFVPQPARGGVGQAAGGGRVVSDRSAQIRGVA